MENTTVEAEGRAGRTELKFSFREALLDYRAECFSHIKRVSS